MNPCRAGAMDKFLIEGGKRLEGRVAISGAKNAALPAMAAALLTDQRVVLRNVPRVRDIGTLRSLLEELGVDSSVTHEERANRVEIEARRLITPVAPYELVKQMRAWIEGAGSDEIMIQGVSRLHGAEHTVIPDRIETGTFITAAAITGGHLILEHCNPDQLTAIISKLSEAGVRITCNSAETASR